MAVKKDKSLFFMWPKMKEINSINDIGFDPSTDKIWGRMGYDLRE